MSVQRSEMRWGVVGLGVGEQHAAAISANSSLTLTALCDVIPDQLKAIGSKFSVPHLFSNEFDLIDSGHVDAVVIASYDNAHAASVVAAIERGIHVFCEKPLAVSRGELDSIVSALNSNRHVRLTTNTLLRRSPRFVWLKEAIQTGKLGSVYHAELSYLYGRLQKVLDGWRGKDPNYSVTLGGTIHLIDLLMWLIEERPETVMGVGGSLGTSESPLRRFDSPLIQDLRIALMQFPSGRTSAVSANYSCVLPHFHRVEVFGSAGTFLNLPPSNGTLKDSMATYYSSRDEEIPPLVLELPYPAVPKGTLIPRFAETIRGKDADISEQSSIDAVAVALAIDTAVMNGRTTQVSYPYILPRVSPRLASEGSHSCE